MVNAASFALEDTPLIHHVVNSSSSMQEPTQIDSSLDEEQQVSDDGLFSKTTIMHGEQHTVLDEKQEFEVPVKPKADLGPTKWPQHLLASWKHAWRRIDPSAFQFAVRMATGLTISSPFVLIRW